MDSPLEPSESPTPSPRRRGRWITLVWSLAILIFIVSISYYIFLGPQVVWLSPEEFARSTTKAPSLSRFDQFWQTWTDKLQRRFGGKPPTLLLNTTLLALTEAEARQLPLGKPTVVEKDGREAWVLSRSAALSFRKYFQAPRNGYQTVYSQFPRVLDGRLAHAFSGESANIGTNHVEVGINMDVTPKVGWGSVRFVAGVSVTDFASPPANILGKLSRTNLFVTSPEAASNIKTNLAVACLARVPKSGALVIRCGVKNRDGKDYWFVLWSAALDARGIPTDL